MTTPSQSAGIRTVGHWIGRLGATAPALRSVTSASSVYELYVLFEICRALKALGASFRFVDAAGNISNIYAFRGGGAKINSKLSNNGHIRVRYNKRYFEVHNDLRIQGQSKVFHELDVSLIDHRSARRAARGTGDITYRSVYYLSECKFYTKYLKLGLGREFIGLCTEFTSEKTLKTFVANISNDNIHTLVARHYGSAGHHGTTHMKVKESNKREKNRFSSWLEVQLAHILA